MSHPIENRSPALNDPELLRQIHALRKTDNYTNWYYLAREYAFLALVIGTTITSYYVFDDLGISWAWKIPVTFVCIMAVGAGQHRISTLTHEAAHYMLFRNRLLNELVSELFCMFPVMGQTHPYRVQHLGHHQYPNDEERDPDWAQLRMSGHRFQFPMSRARFMWECVIKQLIWPPLPARYIFARARFVTDQGPGSPYRLKQRSRPIMKQVGALFFVGINALLGIGLLWLDSPLWLATVPNVLIVGTFLFFALVPRDWFSEYFIVSDLAPRTQALLRLSYYSVLWTGLAWLSYVTGQPWWFFYLLLWCLPLMTSFALFMILRQLVQHGNADQGRFTNTRNFAVNPLIGFAVFPIGNDYHLPHHLFPMVPHYRLREAHALLMDRESYRKHAVYVEGYFFHRTDPPEHPTVLELMTKDN